MLVQDELRVAVLGDRPTGILVRAQDPAGEWTAADVATLERQSLIDWLRSRGDRSRFAESVVLHLLGYEQAPVTSQEKGVQTFTRVPPMAESALLARMRALYVVLLDSGDITPYARIVIERALKGEP